ncbi:MAG: hypothetical protein QM783_16565 [Phycisphaerales bacterium]
MTRFSTLVAVALAAVSLCTGVLRAQPGPAGNAHPQAERLGTENITNPFGAAQKTTVDQSAKKSFADAVDLSPLRDIAVYHNGRVKILGTLATEVITTICARKNFYDVVPEQVNGSTKWRKVNYDPLFTYLDLCIDPAFYEDKALIGVPFHPLRRDILEHVWANSDKSGRTAAELVDSWMKLGRLTPKMVEEQFRAGAITPNDEKGGAQPDQGQRHPRS